jgi:hypothetical protein
MSIETPTAPHLESSPATPGAGPAPGLVLGAATLTMVAPVAPDEPLPPAPDDCALATLLTPVTTPRVVRLSPA